MFETLRAGWDVARYKVIEAEASRELSEFLQGIKVFIQTLNIQSKLQ